MRFESRVWALLKTALFVLLVPGTVAVYAPAALVRLGIVRGVPYAEPDFLALLLVVGGGLLLLSAAKGFALEGQGTPAPFDPPRRLVFRGAYRAVRNPMYVGVGLMLLGFTRWYRAPGLLWYMAAFLVSAHLFVVLYEEPKLGRLFGEQYAEYRRAVGRWVPKFW